MDRRVISLCLSVSFALMFAGCAGKNVTSSSGDEASQAGKNKAEVIQPDAIKTVPLERSFDRPGGSVPSILRVRRSPTQAAILWEMCCLITTGFPSAWRPCRCWTRIPDGFAPMEARPS